MSRVPKLPRENPQLPKLIVMFSWHPLSIVLMSKLINLRFVLILPLSYVWYAAKRGAAKTSRRDMTAAEKSLRISISFYLQNFQPGHVRAYHFIISFFSVMLLFSWEP
ncbi:hypothetical protein HOY80DRAFT_986811 [Tuber brumale]|nr:hypothetical protein HOY80DRAFT_986811 [Tuber brumale]